MSEEERRQCGSNQTQKEEDGIPFLMTLDEHLMVFGQTETDEWYQAIKKIIEEG